MVLNVLVLPFVVGLLMCPISFVNGHAKPVVVAPLVNANAFSDVAVPSNVERATMIGILSIAASCGNVLLAVQ